MNQHITRKLVLALMSIFILASCRKTLTEVITSPPVTKPDTASSFQVSITGTSAVTEPVFALLTVKAKDGSEVISNRKTLLHQGQGVLLTDTLLLAKGSYLLTKLLVVRATDTALYAAPLLNTDKAAQVSTPLSRAVNVSGAPVTQVPVQVLPIGALDHPASFGYTAEEFGFASFLHIKVKLGIRVGNLLYDSLPGILSVHAVNAAGTEWNKEIELPGGIAEISIPNSYQEFSFEASKWNVTVRKNISRQQLQAGTVLDLATVRNPKWLVEETSFLEGDATNKPTSRIEYLYGANSQLSEVRSYQRLPTSGELQLQFTNRFSYNLSRIDTVYEYSPGNIRSGFTAFTYAGHRITNILNRNGAQQTGAAVLESETNGSRSVRTDYVYSNGNTMAYTIDYRNDNQVSDRANSSTGGSESGTYRYDSYINPHYQMNWPDLLFSRTSKNNLVQEQKNYGGNIPSVVRDKFEYVYDADGYPVERVVSFKGYTSGQLLYKIKTVYRYR